MTDYIEVNGERFALNHGQIEVIREWGKKSVKIAGWEKVSSKALVADKMLDVYKEAK